MIDSLSTCLRFLSPRLRWRWARLIPLAVVAALLEAVGAVAVFSLISVIADPGRVTALPILSVLHGTGPWRDDTWLVALFSLLVAMFYVLKNSFVFFEVHAQNTCANDTAVALSSRLLQRYLFAPYPFHLQRNSAELIHNTDSSVDIICRTVLSSAVAGVSEALTVIGVVAVLVIAAPLVTVAVVAVLIGVLALVLRLTQRRFRLLGVEAHELNGAILQTLQQTLGGVKEVKVLGRERRFQDAYARLRAALARRLRARATLDVLPRLLMETLFVCGVIAVVIGVELLGHAGQDVLPLLGLFAYAGLRVLPSAHRIVYHLNNIRFGSAAIGEICDDMMSLGVDASDTSAELETEPLPFTDRIVVDRVSYVYAGRQTPALQDITLDIARGESVGIVGATGAGKSTLIDVVLGLLQPAAGRITVDGADIAQHLRAWQRQIGYVPQTIFLTDDSLRRNVALGLRDDEIDAAKLQAALRMAQLDAFVATLPQGLDTIVGERGVRLSGGQRQRVAIARALYHEPQVLVFDEALAALDEQTESELTGAIEGLEGEKTLLIIAHRLNTVRKCDRLVFLRDGRVVDTGSLEELAARNAEFRSMAGVSDAGSVES